MASAPVGSDIRRSQVLVLDVPLLIEAGMDRICSVVVVVYVDEKTQKERLMVRDGSGGHIE